MKYLSAAKAKLSEPELTVHLEFGSDDTVDLLATDTDGMVWSIARLTKDGKLKLFQGIPSSTGLQLNTDGTIKTVKERE